MLRPLYEKLDRGESLSEMEFHQGFLFEKPTFIAGKHEEDMVFVAISGSLWADEDIIIGLHEEDDGPDYHWIDVPLERIGELRAALDAAEAALIARRDEDQ